MWSWQQLDILFCLNYEKRGINIIHPSISGRIVTKDLPSNVIAIGNPCKVIREVNDQDKEYYFKNRKIGEDFKEYK